MLSITLPLLNTGVNVLSRVPLGRSRTSGETGWPSYAEKSPPTYRRAVPSRDARGITRNPSPAKPDPDEKVVSGWPVAVNRVTWFVIAPLYEVKRPVA